MKQLSLIPLEVNENSKAVDAIDLQKKPSSIVDGRELFEQRKNVASAKSNERIAALAKHLWDKSSR